MRPAVPVASYVDTPISNRCAVPMTSQLRFGIDMNNARSLQDHDRKTRHEFVVDQVQPEVVYRFQVGGVTEDELEIMTEAYRFDSHLNYLPPLPPRGNSPYTRNPELEQLAKQMVDTVGVRGYAMVVGAVDGQLAYELAQISDMKVIVVEKNPSIAATVRKTLARTPLYGTRITVHEQDLASTKYGPFLANVLTSESYLKTGRLPAQYLQ